MEQKQASPPRPLCPKNIDFAQPRQSLGDAPVHWATGASLKLCPSHRLNCAMTELPKRPISGRKQTASFAVVCACVVAARVYLFAIHEPGSRSGWRLPDGPLQFAGLLTLAGVLAALAAWLGLKYFNRTSAILMAAVAGGLATANSNGLIGALPGGLVGLLMASSLARRTARVLAAGTAAILLGIAGGALALWFDPDLSDGPCLAASSVLALVLVIAAVAFFGRRQTAAAVPGWRWARRLGKLCLVWLFFAGLWLSLSVDWIRRARSLSHDLSLDVSFSEPGLPYWLELRPISEEWLWPGPLRFTRIHFVVRDDVTDEDLQALRGWIELREVTIRGVRVTDAGLAHVSQLTSLCILSLASPHLTDRGVALLADLRGLESLDLDGSQITAEGLKRLTSLPRLRWLSLNDTNLVDDDLAVVPLFAAGLKSLSLCRTAIGDGGMCHLTSVAHLHISRTKVTRRGIELFGDRGLNWLDISGCDFCDADLEILAALPFIKGLYLDDLPISDAGVATLAKISGLTTLSLENTAITDAAIPYFEAMPALRWLNLCGTKLSKEGIARLYQTKLNCGLGHD
jgi:Leucine-rich repeat (LRR) protein